MGKNGEAYHVLKEKVDESPHCPNCASTYNRYMHVKEPLKEERERLWLESLNKWKHRMQSDDKEIFKRWKQKPPTSRKGMVSEHVKSTLGAAIDVAKTTQQALFVLRKHHQRPR